ncbi:hypothetical protein Ancab_004919 [Ancistrocladus abbreviatus]
MLRWRKELLEDLIRQSEQPMDGPVNPALSRWINKAKAYARDELNIEELKKRTRGNCCPDIEAGLVIDKKLNELDGLIKEGHQKFQAKGYRQPEINIIGNAVEQLKCDIWQRVSQVEGAGTICIHGIAGVGKTAIAAAINNQALSAPDELFDFVIWVSVSDLADLWRVQEDISAVIAEKLPADPNTVNRAGKLRAALTGKKKFLLILDSMWQGYSPCDIGIPELTGGRKLIVTSRLRSVLDSMGGNKPFVIKPLTNDDAWTLFKHELGTDNLSKLSSEILITRTKNAIQDLQGVPLAIKNLAQTLKNICQKNPRTPIDAEWKEELDCLSRSATFLENRNRELFSSLQSSYQNLRAETRPCYLFCALYPTAHPIETKELIDYWMWEGLLGSGTLTDMRSNGRRRLNELLDAGFLENASEVGEEVKVKMLNLIRDMALAVAGEQLFVQAGDTFPSGSAWPEAVVRASFMRNQLRALKLRGSYSFNSISTLLLQDNSFDMNHDSDFFDGMTNLKVLDLSHTNISSLPNSLSNLTNLRALLLRNCLNKLNDLPSLSNLKRLNVLDFSGTQLEQWPEGLQMLKNIRRLDLTQCKLDIFPASCVCDYRQLEELLMIGDINSSGCVWGSNKLRDWNEACVEWLPDLGHLAVLELVFLNASVFKSYMKSCPKSTDHYPHPATRFKFFVGGFHSAGVDSNLYENSITMIGDGSIVLPQGTLVLNLMKCKDDVTSLKMAGCFRDLTVLDVFEFDGLTYLLTLDMLHSLGNLRKIRVRRCKNMVGIIQPAEAKGTVISHSSLAELVLFDLKCLDSVCDRQVLNCKRLTRIEVWRCPLLGLPKLVGTGPIEIKGEREWWDTFQQRNPGIFEGYPIRFKEAPVPPEVSSSPRVISLDRRTPNYPIISSNHPPVLHQSAGIVDGAAESKLLRNVEKAIGKTAPHKVVDVAKTFIRLYDSVSRLPCPADRGIQEKLDLPVPKKDKKKKLDPPHYIMWFSSSLARSSKIITEIRTRNVPYL